MLEAMKEVAKIVLAMPNKCTGCAACASVCPTNSITMREDKEGFLQPRIDSKTCIACHKCEKTCPIITPKLIPTDFETQAFAAINKDEAVRMRSSSGGMFYVLAKWTIEQGGVVFGSRFNENWEAIHDYTETIEGIEPFMRSKYVQSRIGETFKLAKEFLEQGRLVLYTGTPCQINGLKSYLHKDFNNLFTVDIICHGVPSPKVWREYLKYAFGNERLVEINLRDKKNGWLEYQQLFVTETKTIRETKSENIYFTGFLGDIYLRPSCYDCYFKTLHRLADLTIADYWGVERVCPKMFDNKGTSIVFIHSTKALNLFNNATTQSIIERQDVRKAADGNPAMETSVRMPRRRADYFRALNTFGYTYAKHFIFKDRIDVRLMRALRKKLQKVFGHIR